MVRKGAVSKWVEWCVNGFKLLKPELVKMPKLQYPDPIKHLCYLQMHPNIVI